VFELVGFIVACFSAAPRI